MKENDNYEYSYVSVCVSVYICLCVPWECVKNLFELMELTANANNDFIFLFTGFNGKITSFFIKNEIKKDWKKTG